MSEKLSSAAMGREYRAARGFPYSRPWRHISAFPTGTSFCWPPELGRRRTAIRRNHMKLRVVVFGLMFFFFANMGVRAQSFHELLKPPLRSPKLSRAQHFQDYFRDGKLQLSLHDAILLTLENNSAIQVQESQIETAKFSLLRTYQPFDPTLQSTDFVSRYSAPGFSQIQGPGTFDQLSHQGQFTYSQTFPTGTNIQVQLNGSRYSTNSGFYFINPYWNTS